MSIVFWGISPHPPLLVPGVGKEGACKVQETWEAEREFAEALKKAAPERIIIMSPHAPCNTDAIPVFAVPKLKGSMERFGAPNVRMECDCDIPFIERLKEQCDAENFKILCIDKELCSRCHVAPEIDHGTFIPMYFIHDAGVNVPIVVIGYADISPQRYTLFGNILKELLEEDPVKTAVIASGDLSHRLSETSPYGYSIQGPKFDTSVKNALEIHSLRMLEDIDSGTIEEAGQCGFNAVCWLLGTIGYSKVSDHFLSYEAPFGVGYIIIYYLPEDAYDEEYYAAKQKRKIRMPVPIFFADDAAAEASLQRLSELNIEAYKPSDYEKSMPKAKLDVHVELAEKSVREFVLNGKILDINPADYPTLQDPSAVFVTIKKEGMLRGCIGTLVPVCGSQAEEIVRNAVCACSQDPRFPQVTAEELDDLKFHVSVLTEPIEVEDIQELNPQRYGIYVSKGSRRGLLLPNLEGIDTIKDQIQAACAKGGIHPEENPKIYKFEAIVYGK